MRFGREADLFLEQGVYLIFRFGDNPFDFFYIFLGGVFEGRADRPSNHAFKLLFLLNFISIICY